MNELGYKFNKINAYLQKKKINNIKIYKICMCNISVNNCLYLIAFFFIFCIFSILIIKRPLNRNSLFGIFRFNYILYDLSENGLVSYTFCVGINY